MENTDYMQNPEFRDWLRNIGFDDKVLQDEINNDDTSRLDDLIRRFEEKNRREEDDFAHFSLASAHDDSNHIIRPPLVSIVMLFYQLIVCPNLF